LEEDYQPHMRKDYMSYDQDRIRILGIAGSLRRESHNRSLLQALQDFAPLGTEFEIAELRELPFYDADADAAGPPATVRSFKERIRVADAVVIATPEYNGSISGVLHNALDWASRPHGASPLRDKRVAIASVATGLRGGPRALQALRQLLAAMRASTLAEPELIVTQAGARFDGGRLIDAETGDRLREFLITVVDTARQLRQIETRAA
jgi:chromate reductase